MASSSSCHDEEPATNRKPADRKIREAAHVIRAFPAEDVVAWPFHIQGAEDAMPDVDERITSVEQRLEALGTRMDDRFEQVDRRFEKIDERFEQVDRRFEQVDQRFAQVHGRLGSLEAEVRKLRLLKEQNTSDIQRIAEVQTHHGEVLAQHGAALQRIEQALEPLKVLPAVIHNILPDHERRITALEKSRPPVTGMP